MSDIEIPRPLPGSVVKNFRTPLSPTPTDCLWNRRFLYSPADGILHFYLSPGSSNR